MYSCVTPAHQSDGNNGPTSTAVYHAPHPALQLPVQRWRLCPCGGVPRALHAQPRRVARGDPCQASHRAPPCFQSPFYSVPSSAARCTSRGGWRRSRYAPASRSDRASCACSSCCSSRLWTTTSSSSARNSSASSGSWSAAQCPAVLLPDPRRLRRRQPERRNAATCRPSWLSRGQEDQRTTCQN